MPHNLFNSLATFRLASGRTGRYYSLAALEAAGLGKVSRLPVSLRVDTPIEAEYLRHGGILPYVLREILAQAA